MCRLGWRREETPLRGTRHRCQRVSYTDSQPSITTFTVRQAQPGVRVGKRCVKPTARTRTGRRCTRWVAKGSFRRTDKAGANRFHFTGRLRRRKLAPGTYRLYATPRYQGRTGATRRGGFRIIR